MIMSNNNKEYVKCNECSELLTFNRVEDKGKCLRDSMYKNTQTDQCQFGKIKQPKD